MGLTLTHSETDSLSRRLGLRVRRRVFDEDGCGRREGDLGEARAACRVARATGPVGRAWRSPWPIPSGPPTGRTPRPDNVRQPPGRRQGADGPLARLGGDRPGARRREGRLQGRRGAAVPGPARRRRCTRPRPRASACAPASRRPSTAPSEAGYLRGINRALAEQCAVPLGAAGRQRLRQQRSGRDHARPLHGAGVAAGADRRPSLRPEPVPDAGERRHGAELRVPGDLSERPEPDLRPGPQDQGRADGPPARQPPGDPGGRAGRVRALQPPDRGLGPQARGRDPRRRQGLREPGLARREAGR